MNKPCFRSLLLAVSVIIIIVTNKGFAGDRVYRIHCDNTPPYALIADESTEAVSGLWAEMVRAVMKRMGEKHEKIKIYPWARVMHEGFEGNIDGVFGSQINEDRLKYMLFPEEPLTEESWVFWIRKSDNGKLKFSSLDDLKGHRIGLVRGYNYPQEFMDFVRQEQISEDVANEIQNFKKLLLKRVDYIVSLLNIGIWIAREEGVLAQIHPLTQKALFTSKFYVMFSKKTVSQEWVDRFSKELALYKNTDEFRMLPKKFGFR